jgi:hypothetical protein
MSFMSRFPSFSEMERTPDPPSSLVTGTASYNGRVGNGTPKTEDKSPTSPPQTNGHGGRSRIFSRLSFYRAIQNGVPPNQGIPAHLKFPFGRMHDYFRASMPLTAANRSPILGELTFSSMANNNIEPIVEAKVPQPVAADKNLINL